MTYLCHQEVFALVILNRPVMKCSCSMGLCFHCIVCITLNFTGSIVMKSN